MEQILKNTSATLSEVFSAGYADGAVTVTITDADSNPVSSGAATKDLATAGRYTYVLPPQASVAKLTVVWAGSWGGTAMSITQEAEIVGNHLFTISELRAFGGDDLSNVTTYTDETLVAKRASVTELFERRCGVSFIPRWGKTILDGRGETGVWLNHRRIANIFSVSVNGVALSSAELADLVLYPSGKVDRSHGYFSWWPTYNRTWPAWQPQNVVFTYQHGWTTPPAEISRVGMMLAHYELTASVLADRFISMSNEFGVVRQAQPSVMNVTGIPIIDATLARYDETPALVLY